MSMELVWKMIGAGVIAIIGGVVSSLIGKGYWERLNKKIEDGAKEVKHLRDDNIVKLEKKVEDHINNDKSQQILTELKGLNGGFEKLGDKMDAVREETARQGAKIEANANYIGNTYESLQKHKTEKHQK